MDSLRKPSYIKDGILDVRIRMLFLLLGITILFILRPWIARQNYNRALVFLNIKDYNKSIFHLRKCLITFSRFLSAYERLGEIFEEKGNYKEAIANYKKMIKIDPTNPQGYLKIGIFYVVRMKDYAQAVKWFISALAQDKKNWQAYRWLAICYKNLGRKNLALYTYQEMKKIFPHDKRIDRLIEKLK